MWYKIWTPSFKIWVDHEHGKLIQIYRVKWVMHKYVLSFNIKNLKDCCAGEYNNVKRVRLTLEEEKQHNHI